MLDKLKSLFATLTDTTEAPKPTFTPPTMPVSFANQLSQLTDKLNAVLQSFYKEKGNSFEAYVVGKFSQRYFKLIHWRSDKGADGIYPESNKYPDLVFEFSYKETTQYLAVECKWRSDWYKGGIEWAKKYQVDNYRAYGEKNHMPVFVVIGLGGTANAPEHVYVIPLEKLKYTFLYASFLAEFERKDLNQGFFFNAKQQTLA